MARRNDHSREELQAMALSAAEQLLDEQGGAALSTRKVATAIGYSVGSLYLIFKNLDDLCWQINARTLQGLKLALDEAAADQPAQLRLKCYAQAYLNYAQQWPHRWALLYEHRSPEDLDAPEWLHEAIADLFGRIEQTLRELKTDESDEEITLAARTLWSGVHGITMLKLRDKLYLGADAGPELMCESLIDRYMTGWSGTEQAVNALQGEQL